MIWTAEMGDVAALGMSILLQAQTWWLCHIMVRSQGGFLINIWITIMASANWFSKFNNVEVVSNS